MHRRSKEGGTEKTYGGYHYHSPEGKKNDKDERDVIDHDYIWQDIYIKLGNKPNITNHIMEKAFIAY